MKKKVLIIDDEDEIREVLSSFLKEEGFVVTTASNGFDAVEKARHASYDAMIVDVRMHGIDGIETYWIIKKLHPQIKGIIMTAHYSMQEVLSCLNKQTDCYLQKPFDLKELTRLIQ